MIKEVKPPTSNLTDLLKITLFNATGMPKQSISPILELSQDSDLLFLTETWLLSPTRYKTTWSEYHTYGLPLNSSRGHRGHLGLALLVNPQSNLSISQITHSHPLLSKYSLSIIISNRILIYCLYLPPNLGIDEVTSVLNELPLQYSNTTMTLFCGDFNARLGTYTGDTRFDHRGRIISPIGWARTTLHCGINVSHMGNLPLTPFKEQALLTYFSATLTWCHLL